MRVFCILLLLEWFSFAIELVRDAEIEEYLYDISEPIFKSASLQRNSVKFYLVKENSINAFVYGGSNIFVHTGLIENSNTPNMLEGVIAHELGHIIGAHLIKGEEQIAKSLATYAVSTLLGIGIIVTGNDNSLNALNTTNAAIATTLLGQQIAERGFLSFSRSQEAEADRYAMLFLKKSSISSNGMLELFSKLETIQKKWFKEMDKYSVTHPLTKERFKYFENNPIIGEDSQKLLKRHRFIQAKILAYSKNDSVFTSANEIHANEDYNAYYLTYKNIVESKHAQALDFIKKLLAKYPHNAFFHETIATIYINLNLKKEAKKHFKKAINLAKNNLLLKSEYATFLIKNFSDQTTIQNGIFLLESLKNTEEATQMLYQNLQFAYKKLQIEDYYLLHRIEEIALFENTKTQQTKEKIYFLIKKLEKILSAKPNKVVLERLNRIKKVL